MPLAGIILFAAVVAIVVFYMIRTAFSFAPWIPSSAHMARLALDFIAPSPSMRFIDLGAGDGRIVFLAARKYGMRAYGYELSPLPYLLSRLLQLKYKKLPVTLTRRDLFTADLSEFDIIYLYGLPEALHEKLEPKLEREARPGSYVISYNFPLKSKTPVREMHDRWRNIYIYQY
ncbi:MAG: class I SAM-dependent methyltransferase [Patescibacteria group bacterium]